MPRLIYAIADAVQRAENLVAHPETVLSQEQQVAIMRAMLEALKSSPCFYRAVLAGRKTFCLVDTDPAAGLAIRAWANEAARIGHQPAKILEARAIAYAFEATMDKKEPGK